MSYTLQMTVEGTWLTAAANGTSAFVQLKDDGPVFVQLAQSAPGTGSTEGLVLSRKGLQEVSFDVMEAGDEVYVRSNTGDTNVITVVSPGTAP